MLPWSHNSVFFRVCVCVCVRFGISRLTEEELGRTADDPNRIPTFVKVYAYVIRSYEIYTHYGTGSGLARGGIKSHVELHGFASRCVFS